MSPLVVSSVLIGLLLVLLVVILPEGSFRDGLVGAVVGGLVALASTFAVQEAGLRREREEREEERSLQQVGMSAALAREIATCSVELQTTLEAGPPILGPIGLPSRIWTAVEVPLGAIWHPHAMAEISAIYYRVASAREMLEDHARRQSKSQQVLAFQPGFAELLAKLKSDLDLYVGNLNRQGDELSRRYGWPSNLRQGPDAGAGTSKR